MYLSSLKKRCFLLITVSPTDTKKLQKNRLCCVPISGHKSTLCICGYSFDSFSIFRKIIGLISQRGSAAWFLPGSPLLKPYILFISLWGAAPFHTFCKHGFEQSTHVPDFERARFPAVETGRHSDWVPRFSCPRDGFAMRELPIQLRNSAGFSPASPVLFRM